MHRDRMKKQNLKPETKQKQTVRSPWAQDTRQQLGHSCQPCMLASWYNKVKRNGGKNEPKGFFVISFTPCSAVEVEKK